MGGGQRWRWRNKSPLPSAIVGEVVEVVVLGRRGQLVEELGGGLGGQSGAGEKWQTEVGRVGTWRRPTLFDVRQQCL